MSGYGYDEYDATSATTREMGAAEQQGYAQHGAMHGNQQTAEHAGYAQPFGPGYFGYGGHGGYGSGMFGRSMHDRGQRRGIETKPFFLTSEFLGTVAAIIAVAVSAASLDNFDAPLAWKLITAMVVGYVVSRGIAKAATRSHAADPREDLLGSREGNR